MDILLHYSWPGNVRQLENVIEHAIALTRGDIVLAEYLPSDLFPSSPPINPFPSPLTHSVPEKGEMEIDPKKLPANFAIGKLESFQSGPDFGSMPAIQFGAILKNMA